MTLRLGCIADDYTGASDLANTLQKNGLATVQTIGVPGPSLASSLGAAEAVVVSLKIRSVPAAEAVDKAQAAAAFLRQQGASHILYKICSTFDSTDAGNIGPVLDALAVEGRAVIVTPAFPETGRTVYHGHLFVNGVPLNESPLKDHPLNPMHDANLVRVLQRQTTSRVALANRDLFRKGCGALETALARLAGEGVRGVITDAIDETDLEIIGKAASSMPFSVGASGLGLGLARAMRADARATVDGAKGNGEALSACIAGSCSAATLRQIAAAETIMPVLRLDSAALVSGAPEVERALAFAREAMARGPVLIASSQGPEMVQAVQAQYGRDAAGQAIEHGMARIAAGLVDLGVRHLVVAGGETSGAAVDRLGIKAFRLGPEIAAGVPMMEAIGARHAGLLVALKSGNFGGETFFADALAVMRG
ncbi:MAG: four-carbon acid sugar kinase family protein [Beijerinckiaceae bacterium]|nr:four-carbon acid sugar kinase family protein [Beijerinckiaceae bacterium]